jgi:hypothetical protein
MQAKQVLFANYARALETFGFNANINVFSCRKKQELLGQ